ncbi:DUF302 domain-containing protein [Acidobacteriota bacterium]
MITIKNSTKSMDEIGKGIEDAAQDLGFGVLHVHDLKETMKNKGVEFNGECRIYEVCNARQAKKVVEHEPLISTALPCRISVFKKGSGYVLATMKPTWMIGAFNVPDLKAVAEEVEKVIDAIMERAAG